MSSCSIPSEACCEYGLWKSGAVPKVIAYGGNGPELLMLMPNGSRSAGVMQPAAPGAGCPHRIFPCAKSVWKIAAELMAGCPGRPFRGTMKFVVSRLAELL